MENYRFTTLRKQFCVLKYLNISIQLSMHFIGECVFSTEKCIVILSQLRKLLVVLTFLECTKIYQFSSISERQVQCFSQSKTKMDCHTKSVSF